MQIYPAIDIKRGKVVRVMERGGAETVYADDPVSQAEQFLAGGARWLHVVDLDRAYRTGGDNLALVRRVVATAGAVGASVQVGGLLMTAQEVGEVLETGAGRAIVATAAAVEPAVLEQIRRVAGADRLGLAIDTRDRRPVQRGSKAPVSLEIGEIARRAVGAGISDLVYRDLDRDGSLTGFDLDGTAPLLAAGAQVIVAGGGAVLGDLTAARDAGLSGAIVGRALYEQRFTLGEAIACSGS